MVVSLKVEPRVLPTVSACPGAPSGSPGQGKVDTSALGGGGGGLLAGQGAPLEKLIGQAQSQEILLVQVGARPEVLAAIHRTGLLGQSAGHVHGRDHVQGDGAGALGVMVMSYGFDDRVGQAWA